MCGRGLVLRKWPLLGLDEIHLACSHERARKSQGCESSHLPPGLLVHPFSEHNSHLFRVGAQPHSHRSTGLNTTFNSVGNILFSGPASTVAQSLAVPREGHGHATLEGCCPTFLLGPIFSTIFFLTTPRVHPESWVAYLGLGLSPSPSCLQVAAYHPWVCGTQWPGCRKFADWGQFPSSPGSATAPVGQTSNCYL